MKTTQDRRLRAAPGALEVRPSLRRPVVAEVVSIAAGLPVARVVMPASVHPSWIDQDTAKRRHGGGARAGPVAYRSDNARLVRTGRYAARRAG
jgi:hypothetical protein